MVDFAPSVALFLLTGDLLRPGRWAPRRVVMMPGSGLAVETAALGEEAGATAAGVAE